VFAVLWTPGAMPALIAGIRVFLAVQPKDVDGRTSVTMTQKKCFYMTERAPSGKCSADLNCARIVVWTWGDFFHVNER
jgi:hypothetical protein